MERMQLKYNKEAKQKGIYIISGCGWDGISVDMGVQFLKHNFDGILNSVETYMTIKAEDKVNILPRSFSNSTCYHFFYQFIRL